MLKRALVDDVLEDHMVLDPEEGEIINEILQVHETEPTVPRLKTKVERLVNRLSWLQASRSVVPLRRNTSSY